MGKPQTVAALKFFSDDGKVVTLSTEGTRAAPRARIVSWAVKWEDQLETFQGNVPATISHEYTKGGSYVVELVVRDSKRAISAASEALLLVRNGPIIILPTGSRGPQESITCPSPSVSIPAGSTTASRQTLINANPGATFCFASGTHFADGSNTPLSNQTFVGQFGAVIDGTAWPRPESDPDASPFKAINNGIINVTIRNLRIINMPSYGVNSYLSSTGWTIDHCEISHCLTGVSVGLTGNITNNLIHHNIGNTSDPDPAKRGGGYAISQTTGVLFDNNEVYANGVEQKFIGSPSGLDNLNFIVTNNDFHDNIGNGFWSDGYGAGGVVNDNICSNNGQNGLVLEKGKSISVNRNTVENNLQSGILNTESRDCTFRNNTLDGNAIALDLFLDMADVGTSAWGIDLCDNVWEDNIVTVPNAPSVNFATVLSRIGVGDFTPYTSNAKNNDFDRNTYNVRSSTGNWWNFGSNANWTAWQALPQDINGTRNVI